MEGGVKDFPITETRRAELRQYGVIPLSLQILTFGAVVGLILGLLWFMSYQKTPLFCYVQESFGTSVFFLRENPEKFIQIAFKHLWLLSVVVIGPVLTLVLFIGFSQSRFLLAWKILRFDFRRLLSRKEEIFGGSKCFSETPKGKLLRVGGSLLMMTLLALLAGLSIRYYLLEIMPNIPLETARVNARFHGLLFNGTSFDSSDYSRTSESEQEADFRVALVSFTEQMIRKLYPILWAIVGCCLFVGILSWGSVVLFFQSTYRMARQELEAEQKETESPFEVRSALQRSMSEGDE